jgi:endonuclease YncB( thermonuclease family)
MIAFICFVASITDGDTFRCRGGQRVRLAGIDAPEMPGHCRRGRVCTPGDPFKAKENLTHLALGQSASCLNVGKSYNRVLALCKIQGHDVACLQVRGGFAVKRYSEAKNVCRF